MLGAYYKRSQQITSLGILSSMKTKDLLRKFIREAIGRNYHTLDNSPHTFSDFQDYDIEIDGAVGGSFYLTVFYKQEKILPTQSFAAYSDAHHHARLVIDKDRVNRMNNELT